jgi:hypothetical protein
MSPNARRLSGSAAKSVARGSFWRVVTSWTAIVSTITGATPSTRPEPCVAARILFA